MYVYTTKSKTILKFLQSDAHVQIISGAVGSGTSAAITAKLFKIAQMQLPNLYGIRQSKMVIMRQTFPLLRSTTIATFEKHYPPEWGRYYMNESPIRAVMRFPHVSGDGTMCEMTLLFRPVMASNGKVDLNSLGSLEATAIVLNEGVEMNRVIFNTLLGRIGRFNGIGVKEARGKALIMDFNMPSKANWVYKLCMVEPPTFDFNIGGGKTIKIRKEVFFQPPPVICRNPEAAARGATPDVYMNPEADLPPPITPEYYAQQVPQRPTPQEWALFQSRVLCQWADPNMGRSVFGERFNAGNFIAKSDFVLHQTLLQDARIVIGVDTSGLNPCAVVLAKRRGRVFCIAERYQAGTPFSVFMKETISELASLYPNAIFCCDPANARSSDYGLTPIGMLIDAGYDAYPALTNKPKERIEQVMGLLRDDTRFKVMPECIRVIEGLGGTYCYEKKAEYEGNPIYSDTPDKKNDVSHYMDALQYAALGLRLCEQMGYDTGDDLDTSFMIG